MTPEQRRRGIQENDLDEMSLEDLSEELKPMVFNRESIEADIEEAMGDVSEIEEGVQRRFSEAAIEHVRALSEIKEVRGFLVRAIEDLNFGVHVNFLTVLDNLGRNIPGSEVMNNVSNANHEFAKKIKEVGFGYPGTSFAQCGEDFDGFLEATLEREKNEREGVVEEPSGNGFVDMLREWGRGYTTALAFKFE